MLFSQFVWDLIEFDVVPTIKFFFLSGFIQPRLNSNFMVLLPKEPNAVVIEKFRLIVLDNFLYKIITKILANRLVEVANRIVFCNQFGFIRVQHIEKFIAATFDCINLICRWWFGGNVAQKIDT